ncbi:MAG: 50S ribosomal protein L21 [Parvibaculales bacterium]
MYAVIQTGGKQYCVSKDDVISVERVDGKIGDKVKFDEVLMLGESNKAPSIGRPYLAGASVAAQVLEQGRADKISVIKFKRRKNYHRTKGHRQHETVLKITDISAKTATAKAATAKTTSAAKATETKAAKKATPKKAATKATAKKPATKSSKAKSGKE